MSKEYKISKYSYFCSDDNNNFILYNSLHGINSIAKIVESNIKQFEQLIVDKNSIIEDETNGKLIQQLNNIGFLVDSNEDEDVLYDAKFYEATYRNMSQLIILTTHKCNFKCKYCYEDSNFMKIGEMSYNAQIALLKYIQKSIVNYPRLKVAWFGGEPLMAMNVINHLAPSIVKICNSKKVSYESEITTNGYNLTPEVFDMLYNNKIYIYQITIDGMKEQHDKQRINADGSGTFDKIFANLLYIKNNKKYKLANITIRTNVTREILNHLDEFIEMYNLNFGEDKRFSLSLTNAVMYEKNIANDEKLMEEDYISKSILLDAIYDNKTYETAAIGIEKSIQVLNPMSSFCYAARKNDLIVDTNLNVYKCSVHFNLKENKIGYINQNGNLIIDEALHKKWYVPTQLSQKCRNCFYLPCCNRGGCPFYYNLSSKNMEDECHVKNVNDIVKYNLLKLEKHIKIRQIEF